MWFLSPFKERKKKKRKEKKKKRKRNEGKTLANDLEKKGSERAS